MIEAQKQGTVCLKKKIEKMIIIFSLILIDSAYKMRNYYTRFSVFGSARFRVFFAKEIQNIYFFYILYELKQNCSPKDEQRYS